MKKKHKPKAIEKALSEIAKAIENNETVTSVKVVITIKKQESDKAKR